MAFHHLWINGCMFSLPTRFLQQNTLHKLTLTSVFLLGFSSSVMAEQAIESVDSLYEQALISFQNDAFPTSLI
ncbi:MAG: hypothetical protein OQK03_07285, partial [Colwellia sp.]|nr:hypothetical protein [Colwellia sp.]